MRSIPVLLSVLLLASCAGMPTKEDRLLRALYSAAIAEIRSETGGDLPAVAGCALAESLRFSVPELSPGCFTALPIEAELLVIHELELRGDRRGFAFMSTATPGLSLGCNGIYRIDFHRRGGHWIPEPYGVVVC